MTLSQQEDISIKGQSARQLVMQKLMKGRNASVVLLLRYSQLVMQKLMKGRNLIMQKLMKGRNASVALLFKFR